MSFARYTLRFDRAVVVKDGQPIESNLLTRDGQTVLRKPQRKVAPAVIAPVGLAGVARPGQVITVMPGTYSGTPQPVTALRLLRSGVADVVLNTPSFTILPEDLGRDLTVVETATNIAGTVETRARVTVARLAPTVITASQVAAEVALDAPMPVTLATLSADGDGPLGWTMAGAPAGLNIVSEGAQVRLVMTALPAVGDYPVMLHAANAAGTASLAFALRVRVPAVEAPRQVALDHDSVSVMTDAVLPRNLAVLSAGGTAPFGWAVSGAGAAAEIDATGSAPVLRLIAMPQPGQHLWTVSATNAAGTAAAEFALRVEAAAPVVLAPTVVTMSAASLGLVTDATLPVTLAQVSANGTAPVAWSHDGDAAVFSLEQAGTGMALVLRGMPAPGAHRVNVTARNAAGAASASFALTVTAAAPVVVAPTAVTLSAAGTTLRADAAVPVTLAVLSSNGTAPLSWSLPGAPAWATLDLAGTQPVLRLTAMAPVGPHTLTVRAANAAGTAQASFALTVEAAAVTPGAPVTASAGTITAAATNADGSVTFTLSEDGVAARYTIPAATVTAGHAAMLVPPTVTHDGNGTFTVTKPALVVAPNDDPGTVTYAWHVDGRVVNGATGDSYTRRSTAEAKQLIELVARLTNFAMVQTAATTETRVTVQAAEAFTYVPARFRQADNDMVTFRGPAQAQDLPGGMLYARISPKFATRDGSVANLGSRGGRIEFQVNSGVWSLRSLIWGTKASDGSGISGFRDLTGFAVDDVIDVLVLFGAPMGPSDTRRSCKVRFLKNGVIVNHAANQQDQNIPMGSTGTSEQNILRHLAGETWTLGGKTQWGPTGGIDHDQFRVFYGPGLIAPSLDDMQARFLTPQAALAHPDVARAAYGVPMLDWHNTTGTPANHGTLGAPLSMSVLA